MNHIEYKIVPLSDETIKLLETIRFNAYNIDPTNLDPTKTFYSNNLKNNKYLVFGCYLENQLIGACYISNSYNTLYIEQLFIHKNYQKSELHLGTNLLLHVLQNKQIIESYFQTTFQFSYLEDYQNTKNLYQSLGYQEKGSFMSKRL